MENDMTELFDCKIRQKTFIAASPEDVYDTITSASEWDRFFTTGMVLEPHPGGECSFTWKDWGPDKYTLKSRGKVVEAQRPGRFAFQWGAEGSVTTITFEINAVENGSVVTLTEDGYKNTPEGRAMMLECASGWGEAVTLLKFYMEHGITYTSALASQRETKA
jgi:uncharacterized protein YndB with AHSA1/START domain